MAYGDVEAAFAAAPHVFREELWQHRGGGMAMETRGVLAQVDATSNSLTLWSSTQTPHIARRMLAEILDADLESIRIIAPDVGGGFGPKAIFYPEDAVLAHACRVLGRPGQIDRGPARALSLRHPGARPVLGRGDRGRQ